MPNGGTPATKQSVLISLAAAADAARQIYMNAFNANPGADLSRLYAKEIAALNIWSDATAKELNGDPAVSAAQTKLDAETKSCKNKLSTVTDAIASLTLLDNLVNLATTVGKFFA